MILKKITHWVKVLERKFRAERNRSNGTASLIAWLFWLCWLFDCLLVLVGCFLCLLAFFVYLLVSVVWLFRLLGCFDCLVVRLSWLFNNKPDCLAVGFVLFCFLFFVFF